MHKARPVHQLLIRLQFLEHLQGILHMVDVQHHQTIQVAVLQASVPEHHLLVLLGGSRVKLPATEDEGSQVLLQFLSEGQQLLPAALRHELLSCTLLHPLLLEHELLEVRQFHQSLDSHSVILLHGCQYSPASINPPSGRWALDGLPELLSATLDSLREMGIFSITKHSDSVSFQSREIKYH